MKNGEITKKRLKRRASIMAVIAAGALSLCSIPTLAVENNTKTEDNETAAVKDGTFEMSTSYPGISVKPGETTTFSLDFESLSGDSYDLSLSAESMPDGWDGYFRGNSDQISKVHVSSNNENNADLVDFSLTTPEDAEEGNYEIDLLADDNEGHTCTLALSVDVSELEMGEGSFTTEYPSQQGATGTSFSFDATIVNNRAEEQSYALSADAPSGWQVTFTPSGESTNVASISADADSSTGLTIAVTPAETVTEGEYTIPVTAVSANETLTCELTIGITGSYALTVTTPTGNLAFDAYANDPSTVTLSIQNTGNVDLNNINLTSSAATDWTVEFSESTIDTLEAGATKEVTATVTPSSDVITGDYAITITAANDEATSSAAFRVSVKTHTTWGVIAVVLIVILIAILALVFRKYGRR